jgi:subtilisin family serine protease
MRGWILLRRYFPGLCLFTGLLPALSAQVLSPAAQLLTSSRDLPTAQLIPTEQAFLMAVDNRTLSPAKAEQLGIRIQSKHGDVWSCRGTAEAIRQLSFFPGVRYIDMHLPTALRPADDSARKASRIEAARGARQNGLPVKGKNVILGIVDVGFQTDHPGFWDSSGQRYRVLRFWNQSNTAGPAPQGFTYGRECKTESDVLSERNDDGTHGTHVAGIAGGSGLGSPNLQYAGVAPESDLVFVNIRYSSPTLPGSALGDYLIANPAIIDAYDYILRYANSVGKRAVTNLSWGMFTGPHDGTSLFDRAVEDLASRGLTVVGAAGNSGNTPLHLEASLRGDTLYSFALDNGRQYRQRESIYSDIWGTAGRPFRVNAALVDSFGQVLFETPFFASNGGAVDRVFSSGKDSLRIIITAQNAYPFNGKPNMLFIAEQNTPSRCFIRLGFNADSGTVHAWNSGEAWLWSSGRFSEQVTGNDFRGRYVNGDTRHTVSENGGTGNATLTAGAYVTRTTWTDDRNNPRRNWETMYDAASFTSRGPRVDGHIKPDIVTPGVDICAPLHNRQLPGWMFDRVLCRDSIKGAWNYYGVLSGTSMASPHAAGIAALMLEMDPTLTPQQLRDIMRSTTQAADTFTGSLPNARFGYGKADAFAALMAVRTLGLPGQMLHPEQMKLWPNPAFGNRVYLRVPEPWGALHIQLHDAQGRLVFESHEPDQAELSLSLSENLSRGVYFLKVSDGVYSAARTVLLP